MISEKHQMLLQQLSKTAYGEALLELYHEEMEDLKDVTKCTSWEDTVGRQHAVKTLTRVMSFMLKDKTPQTKSKSQYT